MFEKYPKSISVVAVIGIMAMLSGAAYGDLQNVQVGGSVRIRGDWYSGSSGPHQFANHRYPAVPGRTEVTSPYFGWNHDAPTNAWVEQRSRLNVKADFTDAVSAFIEVDSYDVWGEDFRSNYLSGVDSRAGALDRVSLYQAYIETKNMCGTPVSLRIGRQELKLGNQWLMGVNDGAALFYGLSFDAVRATYTGDKFTVDAFWAKLAETSPIEEDGDMDLYGVYGSYTGIENVTLDAYWLFLRDARTPNAPGATPAQAAAILAANHPDATNLHTVGLRGAGKVGAFDFESEVAYQFGDAEAEGLTFAGSGAVSPYGPKHAKFDNWGANVELGYTFDVAWSPRVYIGGAYLGGEDNRDIKSLSQWFAAALDPDWRPRASVSFNRLFSNYAYSEFIDGYYDLSNVWVARTGFSVQPADALKIQFLATHFESLDDFSVTEFFPVKSTMKSSSNLGTELEVIATYNYTKDLSFAVGYAHLFVSDGLRQGNFNSGNGLIFNGGTAGDDADYVYFDTRVSF